MRALKIPRIGICSPKIYAVTRCWLARLHRISYDFDAR